MKKHRFSDNTTVLSLLGKYGFSYRLIGRVTGIGEQTVQRGLSKQHFHELRPVYLSSIRNKVEALLKVADWDGDTSKLWAEYDQQQDAAA